MTEPIQLYAQEESFDLIIDIDNSSITSLELIKYLSNIDILMKSINHTLNKSYAIGFDQIQLNVLALEKGSFKISTLIKKLKESPYTVATYSVCLGIIAGKLISNNNSTVNYYISDSSVEIKHEVIIEK